MNRDYISYLCKKIKFDDETTAAVKAMFEEKGDIIDSIAGQVFSSDSMAVLHLEMKRYGDRKGLFALCVVSAMSEITYKNYFNAAIPSEIFFDTMTDIRIWADNYRAKTGMIGIDELHWIKHHLNMEIFRIGRLQFQLYRAVVPPYLGLFRRRRYPLKIGEKCIFIHVPQGEKLNYSSCIDSIKTAVTFFEKYFPSYRFSWFVCESWLLYPENRNFMEKDSNIVKFMSLFNIVASVPVDTQAIERIWGKRERHVSDYPVETSLQASARTYIENRGRLGIGYGVISKEQLDNLVSVIDV